MNNFIALDVCPYCGEAKGVVIHQQFKDLPQPCMTSPEPCKDCKERFRNQNIVPVWSTFTDDKNQIQFRNEYFFIKRDTVTTATFQNIMDTSGYLIMKEEEFLKAKEQMEPLTERIQA